MRWMRDCAPRRRLALIPGVHHFAGYGGRRVGYYHKVRRGNNF